MGMRGSVLWDVVEDHLEEAGFLWDCWERALLSPLLRVRHVADGVEERLTANINGLTIAGVAAVERVLEPALQEGEPGEAMAAASALLESPDGVTRFRAALAEAQEERCPALLRALALSRCPEVRSIVSFLDDDHPTVVAAGLDALACRGVDPGPAVLRFLASDDPAVATSALRAARSSALPVKALVERCFQAGDSAIRDTALETGFRLGFPAAILSCRRLAEEAEPGVGRALQLLAMTGDPADVVRIEKTLEVKALRDSALVALGYSGRKSSVEPVLAAMKDAKTARLAGEAFWAITGIAVEGELVSQDVDDSEEPPSFEADDLDANLVPGPEAELPLPNAELAARRWRTVSNGLDPALRYLHGKPFTLEGLVQCFAGAPMRRRHLLALELSVRSRGGFLVGTHDWVLDQIRAERRQKLVARREMLFPLTRLFGG